MTYTNFDLVKDDKLANGQRGLRARQEIKANSIIGIFGGRIIPVKLKDGAIPKEFDLSHVVEIALEGDILYVMEVGAHSQTEFGLAFLNHSCKANIGHRDRIVLYALCDIPKDAELFIDYRTWDWIHEGITCWCPEPKCHI